MHLKEKAQIIADKLWETLLAEDNGEDLSRTGSVTPYGGLKHKKVREAFSWCKHQDSNRFFTRKAVCVAFRLLFQQHELKLPSIPGLSFRQWLEEEARRVAKICQRARKSTAMTVDPAAAETQPWGYEDRVIAQLSMSCSIYIVYMCNLNACA